MANHSSDSYSGDGGYGASGAPAVSASAPGGTSVQLDNGDSVGIVEAARNRQDGFEMGADRAIGSPPNWAAQPDTTTLYRLATENNVPATAEGIGQSWNGHGKDLHQAANDLYNAISELGSVWVGQGAGAAQGTLVAIANSTSQASEAAKTMANRLAQQAAAAAEVKKLPAPNDYDPAQAMTAALAGGPAAMIADQKAQFDAAKEVMAQQVAYLNAYTQSMSEVDGTTPSFGPESLGLPATSSHHSTGGVGVGGVNGPQAVNAAAVGIGGPGAHGLGFTGSDQFNSQTTQAGYQGNQPGAAAHAGAGGAVGSAVPHTPASAGSSAGGGVGAQLGLGAVGAGMGFAAGKTLNAGNRSGSTKQNSNETSATADNQPGNSAASATPQQPGVVSPAGTIGGAGAAPPPTGMGGMGGMGGAAGSQQQEEEHTHASFLIEPDPDDAFGANEATPPPVIGAWNDDEDR
ncbi:hypothetical protein [Amycolatopsis nigrescens]|uniref:hypothetical protein n=1 Tax=Amycolatopsis nigrescens TaxID=381445 RepID=UPI00036D3EA8|nr:hypothetical protein [Amycolatopsis nigrescens]